MRTILLSIFIFICLSLSAQDIFDAARNGDTIELKEWIRKDSSLINGSNASGYSPLIIAAYNNQPGAVKVLLASGANPDFRDKMGNTALIGICFKGYAAIGEALLQQGADVNLANYNDATPLIFASTFGNTEIVQLLLKYKAAVDKKDNSGKTALEHAILQGNEQVAGFLKSARE
jgi:ankyrin repeat protein